MKKYSVIAVLIVSIAFNLSAQNFKMQAPPGYNYIYSESNILKGTEGSPFLGDWENGDILFTSGGEIKALLVRINVLTNQLLYQEDGKTFLMGSTDSISELRLFSKIFIYREYLPGKKSFFEVMVKGKVTLLTKYEVEVTPANYNEALMSGNKNDVLNIKQKLYLQQGANFIPITKKDKLLEVMSDKKTEIANLLVKEKLSLKKRQDMMEIVSFYNQL
jgi:hypothetical protein